MLKDVDINIRIIAKYPENAFWDYEQDKEQISLYFNFHSFKDYQDYIKGTKRIAMDGILTRVGIDLSSYNLPSVTLCTDELREELADKTITVILDKGEELDLEDMPSNPIIINTVALSFEEIIRLLKNPNLNANCQFIDKYNGETLLSLEEMQFAYSYYEYLKVISENLSPSEIAYLVYDLVRGQVYTAENEDEDVSISRNLNETLKNDRIVCLGFANQMAAACNFLGVNAEVQYWNSAKEDEAGHANVVIYLDDKKYGIKGIYIFDPSADSKKDEHDKDYLNYCPNAFFPYQIFVRYAERNGLIEDKNSTISYLAASINRLSFFKKMNINSNIIENEIGLIRRRLIKLNEFLSFQEQTLTDDSLDALEQEAKKYLEFKKVIRKDAMKDILRVVRTAECSIDNDFYAFSDKDLDILYQTSITSKAYKKEEERARELLGRILGGLDE